MITFGPVPSRRLGKSIGINNIPPKICTYSCLYCQIGRTHAMEIARKEYYKPEEIIKDVKKKIHRAEEKNEAIDYLTYVPDGEPTLDINLGREITLLRTLSLKEKDIKIAVITNASLIWKKDVQDELLSADLVSVKLDAISPKTWQKINRPHGSLRLENILEGLRHFSHSFSGDLLIETMLLRDVNDQLSELEKIGYFIKDLKPKKSYLSIPTRPPAEAWVKSASPSTLNAAYQLFKDHGISVEYLIEYEGNSFGYTGDIEENILDITAVHPIREDGLLSLLKKANKPWEIVERLLQEKKLVEIEYNNKKYYIRQLPEKIKKGKKTM